MSSPYLKSGRLADVIAAIQVTGSAVRPERKIKDWAKELDPWAKELDQKEVDLTIAR